MVIFSEYFKYLLIFQRKKKQPNSLTDQIELTLKIKPPSSKVIRKWYSRLPLKMIWTFFRYGLWKIDYSSIDKRFVLFESQVLELYIIFFKDSFFTLPLHINVKKRTIKLYMCMFLVCKCYLINNILIVLDKRKTWYLEITIRWKVKKVTKKKNKTRWIRKFVDSLCEVH